MFDFDLKKVENEDEWGEMTPDQKRMELFRKQKETLLTLRETHAISPEEYTYSLVQLSEKMGISIEACDNA